MQEQHVDGSLGMHFLRLGVTMFFVVANGFFVAAEFALVKVRGTRLDALVEKGNRRARVARHILDNLDHYLSACQLGITVASLILGWLAEPAVAQLLIAGVGGLGFEVSPDSALTHAVSLTIALIIVTVLHMTVGEQAPKIWAIRRPEQMALVIAYPLRVFSALFRPFIWSINGLSNALLRSIGLTGSHSDETHDVAEIKEILATSAAAGQLSHRQVEFAANVLNLVDIETRHILVPRVDIVFLSTLKTTEENLQLVHASGHSRFPLCEADLDSVQGIVHAKDLIAALLEGREPDLESLARPPLFVTEGRSISQLIRLMQSERNHSAVVLDEYGSSLGLVFLEDALEYVVGTIGDEFDQDAPRAIENPDGSMRIPGGMSLPEAIDRFHLDDISSSADTIGGFIVEQLGRLPQDGDKVTIAPYEVTVTEVLRHRIRWLRFAPMQQASDGRPDEGGG
jgi:CBS domain containing-hemolysin-like protein